MTRATISPLVKKVLDWLEDEIQGLEDGQRISTELELAQRYDVSRKTVRAAMLHLEKRGLIQRVRGKGTFPARGRRARPLFRSQLPCLGAVSWPGSGGFYSAIVQGAVHEAMRAQHQLILSGGPSSDAKTEACYRLLDDNRIEGLIVVALTDQELLIDLVGKGKPMVLVDHFSEKAKLDCVRVNSAGGSRQAVEHLAQLGHRRIAFLNIEHIETNALRMEGYREGLAELNLPFKKEWLVQGNGLEGGARAALQLLTLQPKDRPTAILAFSDEQALGAIQAIMRFGLRVPEDISVVGTGGREPPITVGLPELTSMRFDSAELGCAAIKHLLERIAKPKIPPRNVMLAGFLHLGQSSGPPPKS